MRRYFLSIVLLSFCIPLFAHASIVVSEIAWMGTEVSHTDEWIELYNNDNTVDLSGWTLTAGDGTPSIALEGVVGSGEHFLLERSDDTSVPDVSADQIYTGDLGNGGETLVLKDADGNTIDSVAGGTNWENIGGNKETKHTPQRQSNDSWVTAAPTPRAENATEDDDIGDDDDGDDGDKDEGDPVPDIVITEIMYDLEGSDSKREWVEVYNDDSVSADLSEWRLFEGGTNHTLTAKEESILAPGEYAVIADDADTFLSDNPSFAGALFDSSFSLSNEGEELILRNPDLVDIDAVAYQSAWGATGDGHTLSRIGNDWVFALPTPGEENEDEQIDPPTEEEEVPPEEDEETEEDPLDEDEATSTPPVAPKFPGLFDGSAKGTLVPSEVEGPTTNDARQQNQGRDKGEVLAEVFDREEEGDAVVIRDEDGNDISGASSNLSVWLLALTGILIIGVAGVFLIKKPKSSNGARGTKEIAGEVEIIE